MESVNKSRIKPMLKTAALLLGKFALKTALSLLEYELIQHRGRNDVKIP